jgi:hypothetical protein
VGLGGGLASHTFERQGAWGPAGGTRGCDERWKSCWLQPGLKISLFAPLTPQFSLNLAALPPAGLNPMLAPLPTKLQATDIQLPACVIAPLSTNAVNRPAGARIWPSAPARPRALPSRPDDVTVCHGISVISLGLIQGRCASRWPCTAGRTRRLWQAGSRGRAPSSKHVNHVSR